MSISHSFSSTQFSLLRLSLVFTVLRCSQILNGCWLSVADPDLGVKHKLSSRTDDKLDTQRLKSSRGLGQCDGAGLPSWSGPCPGPCPSLPHGDTRESGTVSGSYNLTKWKLTLKQHAKRLLVVIRWFSVLKISLVYLGLNYPDIRHPTVFTLALTLATQQARCFPNEIKRDKRSESKDSLFSNITHLSPAPVLHTQSIREKFTN